MKTSTIPKSKEHEWILSCLHRGNTLTVPFGEKTLTGIITQVAYRDYKLFVTIRDNDANVYRTVELC